MYRAICLALCVAVSVVLANSPGRAQEQLKYPPGYDPNAPRPEAADQALGTALMSATVLSDGTLLRGGGVVSSTRTSTGFYLVNFVRSVADCTCTASFGRGDGSASAYTEEPFISANCPYGGAEGVGVWIRLGGADGNYPFQLIVFCPK